MSKDRLEKIRNHSGMSIYDKHWLIAEIDDCRDEVRRLKAILAVKGIHN